MCFYRQKKANSLVPAFFPHLHGLLRKRGGVHVFVFDTLKHCGTSGFDAGFPLSPEKQRTQTSKKCAKSFELDSTLQPENATYINVCFRNSFPEKFTCRLHHTIFCLELISRRLHYTYSSVIRRIIWKYCLGIIFAENLI